MERDLHSNIDDRVAVNQQAIAGASSVLIVGEIIDTLDFESLEYVIQAGTITVGTVSFVLEEGDDAALADAAAVSADETLGALTGFLVTDDNSTKRVGSIGKKRYQRLSLQPAGATIDFIGASVVLGHPKTAPVAQ